ncbi:hypothetical protein Barb6XT_03195 [Bacteroidales bacterium Barb6XT]|nr:hypothetical protein Barb6XT_03195 [Bacteroidales bacterium Barb6XT]
MKLIFITLLCGISLAGTSQEEKFRRHEFQFTAGINTHEACELEPCYSFMYNNYVGVSIGLTAMRQIWSHVFSYPTGDHTAAWMLSGNQEKAGAALLRPSVRFRIPVIKDGTSNFLALHIEPGLFVNLYPNETLRFSLYKIAPSGVLLQGGYALSEEKIRNKGGSCLSPHIKSYLTLWIDRYLVSAGYSYSSFDIYSNRRNITFQGYSMNNFPWKKRVTGTLFLSAGYLF